MASKYVVTASALKRGDAASPEVFTAIPQITGLTGIGSGQAREIDVTDLDSTAKEFLLGLADNGTISAPMWYDPNDAQHVGIETDRVGQTLRNWQINFSDSPPTVASFAGQVQSFSRDAEVDGVWAATLSIRISGAITFV